VNFDRKLTIVLLEEYENVNLYSFQFENETLSEFENFLLSFKETHPKDIGTILYRLERIAADGVFERHFRYAGRVKDRTAELPSHFESTHLRLYCICISPKILILGNGGLKTTRTYNEDTNLTNCVETLQKIDFELKTKEKTYKIHIIDKNITGDLSLTILDEK
jgi:hypothetical protein